MIVAMLFACWILSLLLLLLVGCIPIVAIDVADIAAVVSCMPILCVLEQHQKTCCLVVITDYSHLLEMVVSSTPLRNE